MRKTRQAAIAQLSTDLKASRLSAPDLHDILTMVILRELTIAEARELADAAIAGYLWYA